MNAKPGTPQGTWTKPWNAWDARQNVPQAGGGGTAKAASKQSSKGAQPTPTTPPGAKGATAPFRATPVRRVITKTPPAVPAAPLRTSPVGTAPTPTSVEEEQAVIMAGLLSEQITCMQKCITALKGDTSASAASTRNHMTSQLNQLHSQRTGLKKPAERVKALENHLRTLDERNTKAIAAAALSRQAAVDANTVHLTDQQTCATIQGEISETKKRLADAEAELLPPPANVSATGMDHMNGLLNMVKGTAQATGMTDQEFTALQALLQGVVARCAPVEAAAAAARPVTVPPPVQAAASSNISPVTVPPPLQCSQQQLR